MRKSFCILAAAACLTVAGHANASTITDPTGDFAGGYIGPHNADLDVVKFSVDYLAATQTFQLEATMAGTIDPSLPGFYAIGANTGTGPNSFSTIGLGGVRFNQVIAVQKAGTATIGASSLPAGSVTVAGDLLTVLVPLSLLPTTGFAPADYGFNIWPRSGAGGTEVISDFAPDDSTISSNAVPEPATWLTLILGFAGMGVVMRRHRAAVRFA